MLAEFYAVVTDPRRVSNPRELQEAIQAIVGVLAMPGMTLLGVPVKTVSRWIELVQQAPVTRGAIFDYQLIASMLANGVTKIYTFDQSDFARFGQIDVFTPPVSTVRS